MDVGLGRAQKSQRQSVTRPAELLARQRTAVQFAATSSSTPPQNPGQASPVHGLAGTGFLCFGPGACVTWVARSYAVATNSRAMTMVLRRVRCRRHLVHRRLEARLAAFARRGLRRRI